jgi:hypothetical protein
MIYRILILLLLACALSTAPTGSMAQNAAPIGVSLAEPQATNRLVDTLSVTRIGVDDTDAKDLTSLQPFAGAASPLAHHVGYWSTYNPEDGALRDTAPRLTYRANAPPTST